MTNLWAGDGNISLPNPIPQPALVDLGGSGFVFTAGGIALNVTAGDLEELATPRFAPLTSQPPNG
jgi:hypothetical protein